MGRFSKGMVFGALLLALATPSGAARKEAPRAVEDLRTHQVQRIEVARERLFEGVIEAERQSTVSAQTTGRVIAVHFDVNDRVEKGALLVELDDTVQKAQVARARASLKAARAQLLNARLNFERVSQLHERGTVPKARFDEANAAFEAARAAVREAEAALKQAEEQLSFTKVRAPYSGIVLARHVQVGELASPGKPLMTGFSLQELRAHVDLPQRYVPVIRETGQASVVLDLNGRQRREVERMVIFPFSNPETNTVTVRLYMTDRGKGLFPGMLVKGAFMVEKARVLAVPESAVAHRGELAAVYRLRDGRIEFVQVRTGRPLRDGLVEVLAGLEEGDRIAADPLQAAILLKELRARAAENAEGRE